MLASRLDPDILTIVLADCLMETVHIENMGLNINMGCLNKIMNIYYIYKGMAAKFAVT